MGTHRFSKGCHDWTDVVAPTWREDVPTAIFVSAGSCWGSNRQLIAGLITAQVLGTVPTQYLFHDEHLC